MRFSNDIIKKGILDLLNLQKLPEDQKQKLLEQMSDVVQSRIAHRIDETLSEDDKKRFDELIMKNPDEQMVNAFLISHVPNFDSIATEEIMKFKEEMVQEVNDIKKTITAA